MRRYSDIDTYWVAPWRSCQRSPAAGRPADVGGADGDYGFAGSGEHHGASGSVADSGNRRHLRCGCGRNRYNPTGVATLPVSGDGVYVADSSNARIDEVHCLGRIS